MHIERNPQRARRIVSDTFIEQLAEEIARYCASNPEARDTLDGIAWWLAKQRFAETRAQLERAVDLLVQQQVLVRYTLGDGAVVFGCAQDDSTDRSVGRPRRSSRM